jgi:hypothetical protein
VFTHKPVSEICRLGAATKALEKAIRCHPADSDPSIVGREMPSRRIL